MKPTKPTPGHQILTMINTDIYHSFLLTEDASVTFEIAQGFEKLCAVTANLDGKRAALLPRTGADGPYEVLEFWLAIQAGGTELCARIEWVEKGKQQHGPVTIMPEPIDPLPNGENVASS
ncbi:hypothetical protein RSAG8_08692, partial [Rhizoctonia solani AG-8 WAC10335]